MKKVLKETQINMHYSYYEKKVKKIYPSAFCQIGYNAVGTIYTIMNIQNGSTMLSHVGCNTKSAAWKSAYNNLTP